MTGSFQTIPGSESVSQQGGAPQRMENMADGPKWYCYTLRIGLNRDITVGRSLSLSRRMDVNIFYSYLPSLSHLDNLHVGFRHRGCGIMATCEVQPPFTKARYLYGRQSNKCIVIDRFVLALFYHSFVDPEVLRTQDSRSTPLYLSPDAWHARR